MLPYFFVIIPVALMAVFMPMNRSSPLMWGLTFVVILGFVGLRHHVGMDWNNYLIMFQRANFGGLWQSFSVAEPGYATLLWIAGQNGWGIYGAYFLGTVVFAAGLFRYAKTTPAPWIALLAAMPYLVFVISMSAARQTIAVGVLLWLTAEWSRATVSKRAMLVLLASSFHVSAIGFLIFIFLDLRTRIWVKILGTSIAAMLMIYVVDSSGRLAFLNEAYISGQVIESGGAIYHVLLNSGPALMCILLGRRYSAILMPNEFHKNMMIVAILLLPLSLVFSTAASRFSVYLFPVSMWFFASLPMLFRGRHQVIFKASVAVFFIGILAIWLNFANNSGGYRNYRNVIFVPDSEVMLCCK